MTLASSSQRTSNSCASSSLAWQGGREGERAEGREEVGGRQRAGEHFSKAFGLKILERRSTKLQPLIRSTIHTGSLPP